MIESVSAAVPVHVAASETQPSSQRLDYLDGLRALAALYVVLHHTWLTIWPVDYHKHPTGILATATDWMGYGHFAVSAFIVISGFCLMLPVVRNGGTLKGGARRFFQKRARRILPPYYFALGLSTVLAITIISTPTGTHWDISLPVTFRALYAHVILVQNFVYTSNINHAFWSIAVECQIYLVFPLLVLLWKRAGGVIATLGVLALSYAAYFGFKYIQLIPPDGASGIVPQYLGLFALGMAGAALAFEPSVQMSSLVRRVPWTLLAVSMMIVLCVLNHVDSALETAYADIVLGIAITCALVGGSALHDPPNPLRRLLSWQPLVFVGTLSYSLYLIHAPLLQVIWQYALHPWHLSSAATFAALVISIPLIVALAYVFFLAFERPFLTTPPPLHPCSRRW